MWGRVVVVMVLLRSVAPADSTPSIEAAIAQAATAGKSLVIEFSATWCKPCQQFQRDVLPLPEVKQALAGVEFVHYDIDVTPGDAAARRYGISGVPAFVVIAADGTESMRRSGLATSSADNRVWFLDLLARSAARTLSSADLERAVAAQPDRVSARLQLAGHYRATGRISDAVSQLRMIVDLPGVDRDTAANATAMADDIAASEARLQTTVDAALAFVEKFPQSSLTSKRLAILAASGRVPLAKLGVLVHEHLDAVPLTALPDAVRVALVVGAAADAKLAISRLTDPRAMRLLGAEIDISTGRQDQAARTITELCSTIPAGLELWCYALEQSVHARRSAGVAQLVRYATSYLAALETPGGRGIVSLDELSDVDPGFGNAIARAVLLAKQRCSDVVRRHAHATIFIAPARPNVPGRVTVQSQVARLETCLRLQLRNLTLPTSAPQLDEGLYAMIEIEPSKAVTAVEPPPHLPPLVRPRSGALVFATTRQGDVDAVGFGVHGMLDLARLPDLQLTAHAQLEAGRGDGTTYSARGLLGLAVPGHAAVISILGGVGVSRFSDTVPRGTEVPVQAHLVLLFGKLRTHMWFQSTRVFDAPLRNDPRGRNALDGDELEFGIGASLLFREIRLFFGLSFERRAAGTTGLFLFGVPIGGYY